MKNKNIWSFLFIILILSCASSVPELSDRFDLSNIVKIEYYKVDQPKAEINNVSQIKEIINFISSYESKGLGKVPIKSRLLLINEKGNSIEFFIWDNLLTFHQSNYSYSKDFTESIDQINLKYTGNKNGS